MAFTHVFVHEFIIIITNNTSLNERKKNMSVKESQFLVITCLESFLEYFCYDICLLLWRRLCLVLVLTCNQNSYRCAGPPCCPICCHSCHNSVRLPGLTLCCVVSLLFVIYRLVVATCCSSSAVVVLSLMNLMLIISLYYCLLA